MALAALDRPFCGSFVEAFNAHEDTIRQVAMRMLARNPALAVVHLNGGHFIESSR
ncbi:hypothetical protein AB4Y44_30590 [Paraburkholderia sp. BR10937]